MQELAYRIVEAAIPDVDSMTEEEVALRVSKVIPLLTPTTEHPIHEAFFDVLPLLPDPQKDTEAGGGKKQYKYPAMKNWWPTHRALWRQHGVRVQWAVVEVRGVLYMECRFIHRDDPHYAYVATRLPYNYTGPDPQMVGSWSTYLQRYTYLLACSLVPDAEDDGEVPHVRQHQHEERKPASATQGQTPRGWDYQLHQVLNPPHGESRVELVSLVNQFMTEKAREANPEAPEYDVMALNRSTFEKVMHRFGNGGRAAWDAWYEAHHEALDGHPEEEAGIPT